MASCSCFVSFIVFTELKYGIVTNPIESLVYPTAMDQACTEQHMVAIDRCKQDSKLNGPSIAMHLTMHAC